MTRCCCQRLKANATIFAVILLHLAISDLDVLEVFFLFCFVKASIWMSYLLFSFIILQTCCAAFQSRQNEPAISATVIAENKFAACNYLDYPFLVTAFTHWKVYHTHLKTLSEKKRAEGLLLVLQPSTRQLPIMEIHSAADQNYPF